MPEPLAQQRHGGVVAAGDARLRVEAIAKDLGILWTKASDDFASVDGVEREGCRWIPTRYLLRDPSPLRSALASAGLSIEWQTIVPPGNEGEPAELQIVCRKTA